MVSNIDPSKPETGIDQPVQVIRENFSRAKLEIEDLQSAKVTRTGDSMLGVLKLLQSTAATLPSPAQNTSGIVYITDTSSLAFSNGLNWISVVANGDMLSTNNLSDVVDTQISIDNLTLGNTVSVDVLQFEDHGANMQMWTLEEDSASPTNALTFDYAATEALRITPTGDATFVGVVTMDGIIFADHGSNSQVWNIEEDSSSPTNTLTMDYNSRERFRFSSTGVIKTGDAINESTAGLGIILQAGGGDGPSALPGNAELLGGAGSSSDGGDVTVQAGDGETSGDGGSVFVSPGPGAGAGADGTVVIGLSPNALTWPDLDGNPDDVLSTDGSGTLLFKDPSIEAFRKDPSDPSIILTADSIVVLTQGTTSQIASLPAASAVPIGKVITLKNGPSSTASIIIPAGVDTIDSTSGPNTTLLLLAFDFTRLASDGVSDWSAV